MSLPEQPVITEKAHCLKHPETNIEWTCSAGSCPYRVLCKECIITHENYFPHHSDQISPLNEWSKQYQKLAKNFDPRQNHQLAYHVEEIGMLLKKEKYGLEKLSKALEESFEAALSILLTKVDSMKEVFQENLWRDFNRVSADYNSLIHNFSELQKLDAEKDICKVMNKDLTKYLSRQNIKEYFDRVYTGYYDEKIFNNHMNSQEIIANLKKTRKRFENGLKIFDAEKFEAKWTQELERFILSVERACDDDIFRNGKLEFLNTKSPKLNAVGKSSDSSYVTCLSSQDNLSACFITKADNDMFLTISEQRTVNILDPNQNFRVLKQFNIGEETIQSVEIIKLDPVIDDDLKLMSTPILAVLGGSDDYPTLEVWDCLRNKRLFCLENIHDYGISCLKLLKKETLGLKEIFYMASGFSDGAIKLWQIDIFKLNANEKDYNDHNYKVEVKMLLKSSAHDLYTTSIVSIPSNKKTPYSMLISSSNDKSLYLWRWESELKEQHESHTQITIDDSSSLKESEEESKINASEKYGKKVCDAHTDYINAIVLISDKADSSDIKYYATGDAKGLIKVWKLATNENIQSFSNDSKSPIVSMEYLKGDRIACTENEMYVKQFYVLVWNWKTASLLLNIRDHQTRVTKIFSLQENIFATCDKNGTIKIWQLEEEEKPEEFSYLSLE